VRRAISPARSHKPYGPLRWTRRQLARCRMICDHSSPSMGPLPSRGSGSRCGHVGWMSIRFRRCRPGVAPAAGNCSCFPRRSQPICSAAGRWAFRCSDIAAPGGEGMQPALGCRPTYPCINAGWGVVETGIPSRFAEARRRRAGTADDQG